MSYLWRNFYSTYKETTEKNNSRWNQRPHLWKTTQRNLTFVTQKQLSIWNKVIVIMVRSPIVLIKKKLIRPTLFKTNLRILIVLPLQLFYIKNKKPHVNLISLLDARCYSDNFLGDHFPEMHRSVLRKITIDLLYF